MANGRRFFLELLASKEKSVADVVVHDASSVETKENGTEVAETAKDEPFEEVVNEQELKYWKSVKENPADFTSWTYLLQFVEQEVGHFV